MASIRLEKFAFVHHAEPGTKLVGKEEIDAIRTEAFKAGVREGAAAATDAFSSEQSRCLSRIQEVIGDTFFVREEAHRLALSSLRPLVETLAKTVAPALCSTGLPAEIAKTVDDIVKKAPSDTLTVFVSKGLGTEFAEILSANTPVRVSEDHSLDPTQARVSWNGGYDLIDLGATSDAALEAINTFFNEVEHPSNAELRHAN